jgi:hypothetical protein
MNYHDDVKLLHADDVTDFHLRFRTPAGPVASLAEADAADMAVIG